MPLQGLAATLVSIVPVVLLAIVTFNTPFLKSLYFLKATYSGFEATFGTLGYCTTGGTAVTGAANVTVGGCVGPTIGYQFDPDTIFGLSNSLFDIPTVVTKYLTYVLFLHAVALIFAVAALVFNALDMIPRFSVACFPTFCAWATSFFTLVSFVLDVVMFYIAKARIDKVSGASAKIGYCVWITLAAWVVTGFLGCLVGLTGCCASRVKKDQKASREARYEVMKQDKGTPVRDEGGDYPDHIIERTSSPSRRETEVAGQIAKYGSHDDEEYKLDHYGSTPGTLPYGAHQQPIDGVGYGYGQRTSQEYLLNPAGGPGQPRMVSPPRGDRGYVPSSSAYPDPYASHSQGQEILASQIQNPYGTTPFPAAAAGSDNDNLVPGHPPVANLQNRAMTPASTYAGSFVGVGSGRHEGMPLPVEMGVAGAGAGMAYAGARQMRQGSGSGQHQPYSVYGDAQYGQQQATQQYPYPQQQQQQQNPYAANTMLMRPPSSEEQRRQTMYAQPQGASTQDAYGGYEEPPMSGYPSQAQPANYRNTMHTVAPQPQRLHTQGVNAPSFPLDHVTSPTSHQSHSYTSPTTGYAQGQVMPMQMQMPEVERARDMGPVNDAPPPMYNEHGGASEGAGSGSAQHNVYPPQQQQYGGNAKSGYFN